MTYVLTIVHEALSISLFHIVSSPCQLVDWTGVSRVRRSGQFDYSGNRVFDVVFGTRSRIL